MSDEQEQLSFGLDGEARPSLWTGLPHPPTPEQAAAIDGRRSDVFLEAGAGTGKTRVLVSCHATRSTSTASKPTGCSLHVHRAGGR